MASGEKPRDGGLSRRWRGVGPRLQVAVGIKQASLFQRVRQALAVRVRLCWK